MDCQEIMIRPEEPGDFDAISALHEEAFGPGRFARSAYRVREGADVVAALSQVALIDEMLVGSIRFTAITIGGRGGALLLGPLVIKEAYRGRQCGLRLMQTTIDLARAAGFKLVLLVGDLPYYERALFKVAAPGRISLPGPVDPARLLVAELEEGVSEVFTGLVRASGRQSE